MIFDMSVLVAMGLLFTFLKMSWRWKMWALSHPISCDVIVFILLLIMHGGTFSGGMIAAVSAMLCSAFLALGRWLFGHCEKGYYFPGVWNVKEKFDA